LPLVWERGALAANQTWSAGSDNWSVADDWSGQTVPVNGDNVPINGSTGDTITFDSSDNYTGSELCRFPSSYPFRFSILQRRKNVC
jgi:hypothetical protein